jgi:tryptophan-rich sensory protein
VPYVLKPAVRVFLILTVMAGGGILAGWWAPRSSMQYTWYVSIEKPSWSLPVSALAPAGAALYCLLGLAIYLQERRGASFTRRVLPGVILALGILWSYLFYELNMLLASSVVMISMWCVACAWAAMAGRAADPAALVILVQAGAFAYCGLLNVVIYFWSDGLHIYRIPF